MKAVQKLWNVGNFIKKPQSQPTTEEYEEKGVVLVLKFNAHCPHCAKDVKNCIKKMKGVLSVDLDVENSQVTVKGVFDVQKLVRRIFIKAKKLVKIVKREKAGGGGGTNAPSPTIDAGETSNNNEGGQREESNDDHSHEVETEKETTEEKGSDIGEEKNGEIKEAKD